MVYDNGFGVSFLPGGNDDQMAKTTTLRTRPPTAKRSAKRDAPVPFDAPGELASCVKASGLTLDALQHCDAGTLLDRLSRELAADLQDVPAEQREVLLIALAVGFITAMLQGLQLGALAVTNWKWHILEVIGAQFEAGQFDAEAYGSVLALFADPETVLVLPADEPRVH